MSTALITTVAPYFTPYLQMIGLMDELYYFRKESTALRDSNGDKRLWHARINHGMLRGYHSPSEGILYAAFPASVLLNGLRPDDLLYIGCSASGGGRFWRGRLSENIKFPALRSCFHHEQMRRGRDGSNLESYLEKFGSVVLHTMTSSDALAIAKKHQIALPDGKYPAHQLERAILAEGYQNWKWNARC